MSTPQELLATLAAMKPVAACADDDRFIQTPSSGAVSGRQRKLVAELESLCDSCPIRQLCRDTAEAIRATDGFWAGKSYARRTDLQDVLNG